MKNLEDLEIMKNKPMDPFDNQYDFFFIDLENDYIKSNINKMKYSLKDWNSDAKKFIIHELIKNLISNGTSLDSNDLRELNELVQE